ncbi:MAG TPA: TetR/AcrR family transcriptional regulator [Acidobacteriaceae bacterium]
MKSGPESARKPRPVGPRREEILAAALKLFGEHGMHAVTTRQIAAAVGISQPSLYAFFPNRQALEAEVCTRAFEELTSRITAGLAALKRGNSGICKLGRIYVDFGLENPDAYRLAFMVEKPDPVSIVSGGEDPILAAGLKAFHLLREAVGLTVGSGLRPQELEFLAQSQWAALHGLVSLLLARPNFPWRKRNRLIEFHISRVFA